MKIRTIEDFNDRLDQNFSWRFFELQLLNSRITKNENQVYLRAGIALLYAHWEGFVKQSAECFLIYISNLSCKLKELNPSLMSIFLKSEITRNGNSLKYSSIQRYIEYVIENYDKNIYLPYKDIISTNSNLKSEIFKDIVLLCGLDYSVYQLKEKIIDGKLLYYRNSIAHGEYLELTNKDYDELFDYTIGILKIFKNQLQNSIINKEYLR